MLPESPEQGDILGYGAVFNRSVAALLLGKCSYLRWRSFNMGQGKVELSQRYPLRVNFGFLQMARG